MGTTITKEQNSSAAKAAAENLSARFGDAGVTSEVVAHSAGKKFDFVRICLLYTSPSPRDQRGSRMPSSA